MLLDQCGETVRVSALQSVDDALVLEEKEGGHGADTVALRHGLHAVYIDLEEGDVGMLYVEQGERKGKGQSTGSVLSLQLKHEP